MITLLKCTFQGMKKTPARTIPNSSYSNTRELFHTGPVIDQSEKNLIIFQNTTAKSCTDVQNRQNSYHMARLLETGYNN